MPKKQAYGAYACENKPKYSSRSDFWVNYLFFNIFEKKTNEKVKTIITIYCSMCSSYN